MGHQSPQSTSVRPPISVVVPFRGGHADAERMWRGLSCLDLCGDDELIVADNTDDGVVEPPGGDRVRIERAMRERSSYHARNVGAAAASKEWLLFVDADCTPEPGLLDAYFAAPIAKRCGAISGRIVSEGSQASLLARYARSRHFLDAADGLLGSEATPTGNLLARRVAFDSVGGFTEGIASAGDLDFGRRLRSGGWSIAHCPAARAEHRHREDLWGFLRMIVRYGAGARWLNARYPGSSPRWPLVAGLARATRDTTALAFRGQLEPALFRAIDGAGLAAHNLGYLGSNSAPRR